MTAPAEPRQREGWRCCATCWLTTAVKRSPDACITTWRIEPSCPDTPPAMFLGTMGKRGHGCVAWLPSIVRPRPVLVGFEMRVGGTNRA